MFRRIATLLPVLTLSTLLTVSAFAATATAATMPSDLMLPVPAEAARGIVVSWTFSIELDSSDRSGIDRCRKIMLERGLVPTLSVTASTATPDLHFKLLGSKEYPQASPDADAALEAVQQARCASKLSWTVTSTPRPAN